MKLGVLLGDAGVVGSKKWEWDLKQWCKILQGYYPDN